MQETENVSHTSIDVTGVVMEENPAYGTVPIRMAMTGISGKHVHNSVCNYIFIIHTIHFVCLLIHQSKVLAQNTTNALHVHHGTKHSSYCSREVILHFQGFFWLTTISNCITLAIF